MKKTTKILLVAIFILSLTGCWDKKELSQQVFVLGMGIDLAGEDYKITAQLVKPVPPGPSGIQMTGSENPTWNISARGRTIYEAVNQLDRVSPRRLEWTHLTLVVINKDVAKKGLQPIMTWFEREPDTNSSAIVIVTSVSAEDLLNVRFELENIPSKSIADLIKVTNNQNVTARRLHMHEFNKLMNEMGIDPSVDMVEPRAFRGKVQSIQITGTGIFNDDKFVGEIRLPDNIGIEIMSKRTRYAAFTIPCPDAKNRFLTFQAVKINRKIRPTVHNGEISVRAEIFMEGNIAGTTCTIDFTEPKTVKLVEKNIEKHVKNIILNGFKTAAEKGSDVYGIGRELKRKHPKRWHEVQNNWHNKLTDISMDIHVEAKILRTGLIRQHPTVK